MYNKVNHLRRWILHYLHFIERKTDSQENSIIHATCTLQNMSFCQPHYLVFPYTCFPVLRSFLYFLQFNSLDLWQPLCCPMGFPGSSAGEESTCNAGDPNSIPGLRRTPGKGIGYTLQYSWASLLAQMVKNQPTIRETWVWSLGWEDPVEWGMTTHSSILAWRIPMEEKPGGL